jgi:hypothetical protein
MITIILSALSLLSLVSLFLTIYFLRQSSQFQQHVLSQIIATEEKTLENTMNLQLMIDDLVEYKKDITVEVYNAKLAHKKTAANPDV